MVEGHVDLARVTGLEDALPRSWCGFKQTCQSGQSFFYLSNIMPKFFLNVFYGTDSSFPLVSHIFWPLKINSALNISLDVLYDVCMHDTRNMEWYVMLKNVQLIMFYYQSMHDETLKKKRQKRKHLSNPSPHLFCKFSHRVTLSRSSFIHTSIFRKNFFFFFDHFQHGIFLITAFYSKWSHFFLFNIPKYIFLKKMNKTLTFNFLIFYCK